MLNALRSEALGVFDEAVDSVDDPRECNWPRTQELTKLFTHFVSFPTMPPKKWKDKREADNEYRKRAREKPEYYNKRRKAQTDAIEKCRKRVLLEFDNRGARCQECGYRGPYVHFEWAHIKGLGKEECISTLMLQGSLRKLDIEFPKVLLKCRFCHSEETALERGTNLRFHYHVNLL